MDWPQILQFYDANIGRGLALASLVDKSGASFRQPGARLLIRSDGAFAGSVSAGCLEASIAEVGRAVIDTGQARIFDIDTRPYYGCYGTIKVAIEPVTSGTHSVLIQAIREAITLRTRLDIITDFSSEHADLPLTQIASTGEPTSAENPAKQQLLETIQTLTRIVVIGLGQTPSLLRDSLVR